MVRVMSRKLRRLSGSELMKALIQRHARDLGGEGEGQGDQDAATGDEGDGEGDAGEQVLSELSEH